MSDNRRESLCNYRMAAARETLQVAQECFEGNHYKDAINRSYYAAFYAVNAVPKHRICSISESIKLFRRDRAVLMTDNIA